MGTNAGTATSTSRQCDQNNIVASALNFTVDDITDIDTGSEHHTLHYMGPNGRLHSKK